MTLYLDPIYVAGKASQAEQSGMKGSKSELDLFQVLDDIESSTPTNDQKGLYRWESILMRAALQRWESSDFEPKGDLTWRNAM